MKYFVYLIAVFLLVNCTNSTKKQDSNLTSEGAENKEVAVEEAAVVTVEKLLENPQDYADKQVIVTGTVTHVCKHSGKRLHLLGSDENTKVRLEAGDIGKFERELEGSEIIAKGIFRREVIDEEYLAKWADELGKEGGEKSHEEQEEEKGKMQQYREMMKETDDGFLENFWVDGISFETVKGEAAI